LPGAQTAAGRGTSYAAPVVSAVLAALRAYKPSLTVAEAERLLLDTAKPGGAGRRLDAAAAFRAAGLTPYVTAPDPLAPAAPAAPTGGAEPNAAPAAANGGPPAVMQHVQAMRPGDPLASLGVRRPKLRASTYRRGVLTVVVSGVPDFGRAVFTVDRRTYSRASGKLRIRLKRPPKRISVVTQIPYVGRTAPLRVKVRAAARSATSNRRLKRGA
ncbi:MAG: Subtilase family, partial [Solirubrobacteraceae bacterium]|nr:Subtilase family [Solirubrobacteraceae bacterium]